jgi:hypothetical protein
MSPNNVIRFDLGRRSRRNAVKADQAAASNIYATVVQLLESDLLRRAHESAWQILSDGLPRQSMGEPGGGNGGHGDPTLGAVMANEQMTRMLDDLAAELERAQSAMVHAFRLATSIVGQTVAPAEAEAPGAGHCQRCSVWVSGSSSDRIKSGYCQRCYKAWQRAGNPDRMEFNGTSDEGDNPVA